MFNKNRGIEYSKCKSEEIEIERKIIPISEIKKKLKNLLEMRNYQSIMNKIS